MKADWVPKLQFQRRIRPGNIPILRQGDKWSRRYLPGRYLIDVSEVAPAFWASPTWPASAAAAAFWATFSAPQRETFSARPREPLLNTGCQKRRKSLHCKHTRP